MMRARGRFNSKPFNMSRTRSLLLITVAATYAVLWTGGILHHWLKGQMRADQNWLASLFLLLAGLIVLITTEAKSELARLIFVAVCGLLVEAFGVRYGLPFGRYVYTDVLEPQLFGVPLVMMSAWMVLFAYLRQMLRRFKLHAWSETLCAAVCMTTIDLLIDPLAAQTLGYWRWLDAGLYYGIPASNFAGWFVTSLFIFGVARGSWKQNRWTSLTGLSIILFFSLIALAHALYLAAIVGLSLCVLHLLIVNVPPAPLMDEKTTHAKSQKR